MNFTQSDADARNARYANMITGDVLRHLLVDDLPGEISVVSSFGTESAVLLHMVARADRHTPVIFIDTLKLFGETLAYRDQLINLFKLTNVNSITPDADALAAADPRNILWMRDPNACCEVRKVLPLKRALTGVTAWISGRKGFQAETRKHLPQFEIADGRLKINPLAHWTKDDLNNYFDHFNLPHHPLEAEGYASIGCMPCTTPIREGEDIRAGRWRGMDKEECGIHTPLGQTEKLSIF